jgi:ABC-type Mn2+/Zn2+ transport system ATPase subunit
LPKPLYQLSTGSRRKVFLAAALVQPAPLTLLDQPFMALDRPSVDFLCACFRAWTHQPDRLLLIADYLPPQDVPLAFTLDLDLTP